MTDSNQIRPAAESPAVTGPAADGPAAERLPAEAAVDSQAAGLPAIPASAGAMIFDRKHRLLILKPTYKKGWTIPGGVMEADGETDGSGVGAAVGVIAQPIRTRGRQRAAKSRLGFSLRWSSFDVVALDAPTDPSIGMLDSKR